MGRSVINPTSNLLLPRKISKQTVTIFSIAEVYLAKNAEILPGTQQGYGVQNWYSKVELKTRRR
jgi:hypothetical protein